MNQYIVHAVEKRDAEYAQIAAFAAAVYDANVIHPLRQVFPGYICVHRRDQLNAVVGFRSASGGLFLEQYLEESVEQLLQRSQGLEVTRDKIAELGAFHIKSPSLVPLFSKHIERLLMEKGFSHALALSDSAVGTVHEWCQARAAMLSSTTQEFMDQGNEVALDVCVLALECRG
ncbi:thermostable hemolysin [Congregibacter variabilis]|uniref:Thermostable hemolysin n=1 Tax=Congregibacter variabilis TaxID=3081200 RepID=A0ABZ0I4L4_9GAMM|nr:thermostable hemolysin [Congregibacter sp. IMCC43200]